MIATITYYEDGSMEARVRRNHRSEIVWTRSLSDEQRKLRVGDRIEVKRQTNNPYLVPVN